MLLPTEEWSAYRARLRDEHNAGWLTSAHYLVLCAIADLYASGDDEPTNARISAYCGKPRRTVQRAKAKAKERGLLLSSAQFVPVDGRRQQRANRYELAMPAEPCRPKPPKLRGRQSGAPSGEERKQGAREVVMSRGPDLLAMRRAAMLAAAMAARTVKGNARYARIE